MINKYTIFSLFSNKWAKVPLLENATTSHSEQSIRFLEFLELFDIEYDDPGIKDSLFLSEEDKKSLAKNIIQKIDIISLFTMIAKGSAKSAHVIVQSDTDLRRYIASLSSSNNTDVFIGSSKMRIPSGLDRIYSDSIYFRDPSLKADERCVFVFKGRKNKIGKLVCQKNQIYVQSYNTAISSHAVTIDPDVKQDSNSYPFTKTERDKYEEKNTALKEKIAKLTLELSDKKLYNADLEQLNRTLEEENHRLKGEFKYDSELSESSRKFAELTAGCKEPHINMTYYKGENA